MDSFGPSQRFHVAKDNLIDGECFLTGSRGCEKYESREKNLSWCPHGR